MTARVCCPDATTRRVPAGHRARVECGTCGRLVAWEDVPPVVVVVLPAAAAPAALPVANLPAPSHWLYVSRRLDLLYVEWPPPPAPPWVGDAFYHGPAAYYRVTPAVVVWLECAGDALETKVVAGEVPRGQLDDYLAAMDEVSDFARVYLDRDELRRARSLAGSAPPVLPDPPVVVAVPPPVPRGEVAPSLGLARVVPGSGVATPPPSAAGVADIRAAGGPKKVVVKRPVSRRRVDAGGGDAGGLFQ